MKGDFKMIGLGNWACNVNTMFFTGEVKFKIFDGTKIIIKYQLSKNYTPKIKLLTKNNTQYRKLLLNCVLLNVFSGRDNRLLYTQQHGRKPHRASSTTPRDSWLSC